MRLFVMLVLRRLLNKRSLLTGLRAKLGVNHFGHFLLCGLLCERIEASAGRIVIVASNGYRMGLKTIQFEDMNMDKTIIHGKPIPSPN